MQQIALRSGKTQHEHMRGEAYMQVPRVESLHIVVSLVLFCVFCKHCQ